MKLFILSHPVIRAFTFSISRRVCTVDHSLTTLPSGTGHSGFELAEISEKKRIRVFLFMNHVVHLQKLSEKAVAEQELHPK